MKPVSAMQSAALTIVMIFMLLTFAFPASAITLLDTIDRPFEGPYGYNIEPLGQSVAVSFSSATAVTITDITAYIGGSGSIVLGIMSDASGSPSGTFIFSQAVPVSASNPVVLSSLNWSIAAGSTNR